jgi:hypothetical protein
MIYSPEIDGGRKRFAKDFAISVAKVIFYAIDEHKSPFAMVAELRQRDDSAEAEWHKLLEKYSPERLTQLLSQCAQKVDSARLVAVDALSANEGKFLDFSVKRILKTQGVPVDFTQFEAWLDYFYDTLGTAFNNKSLSFDEKATTLCELLAQLDRKVIHLRSNEGAAVEIFDFSLERDEASRSEAAELHRMARQYVISQLAWIVHKEDEYKGMQNTFTSTDDFEPDEETTLFLMEKLKNKKISRKSKEELQVLLTAHVMHERAHIQLLKLIGGGALGYNVHEDLSPLISTFRKTRPEQVEYLEAAMNITLLLQAIISLTGAFSTSEHVYTGVHPAASLKHESSRIIEQVQSLEAKYQSFFDPEELEPFRRFVRDVAPLLGSRS